MPSRILKDSIFRSEKINGLSDWQYRLWTCLIDYVDDYGRGDARPQIIKGMCFPLRERVTLKDIEKGLADLAGAGCVGLYTVDGKPYLYFPNWEKHQRVRTKVSKCPSPEECDATPPSAADCGELPQNAARIQNPIRIQNPNPESESKQIKSAGADRDAEFEKFWSAYPKKVGKKEAKRSFAKIQVPLETLLNALEKQKRTPQWTKDRQFIPNPATWLNHERWDDEVVEARLPGQRELDADELEAIRQMTEEGTDGV